jgi:hypothetical protein
MALSTAIDISAPAERVWSILIDTQAWPRWGPSVRAVEHDGRFIRPGSRGRVQTAIGIRLPFLVTEFVDGEYWAWEVAGIPATGHRVSPVRDDQCRLYFDVPLLAAPYLAVCRAAVRRIRGMAEGAA